MKIPMNNLHSKSSHPWTKVGIALALAIALVSVMVFFVFAASNPIITTVAGGRSGSWVQVRIDNLPANVDYVVYEGFSGTQGIGGTRIAGFNSGSGGTQYYRFELATDLMNEQTSELRIVGSDGSSAWQTIGFVVTNVPGTRAAGNVPVTGATATPLATSAASGAASATPLATSTSAVLATATPLATSAAGGAASATPLATSAAGGAASATPLATMATDTSTPAATSAAGAATPLATSAVGSGTVTATVAATTADTSTPAATVAATTADTSTPAATSAVGTATPAATSAAGATTSTPVASATLAATATVAPTTAAGTTTATPVASSNNNTGTANNVVVPVTGPNAITNLTFSNQIMMTRDDFGGVVSFLISNLPLNTDYTVRIGPAGQNGLNGYVVAHFYTGGQTSNIATFEIPVLLRNETKLDLRLEGQDQTLVKTFSNTNFPVATNQVVQSK